MPILATFLGAMFTAALKIFLRFFSLEKAARIAAWSVAMSLTVALVAAMMVSISSVSQSITSIGSIHPAVAMGFGIAFNGITIAAVGSYLSIWIFCQLYVIKKQAINMIVKL